MTKLLLRLFLNAAALFLTTLLVPGLHLEGLATAIWAALVWGLVNTLIRPILSFFTIPLQLLTLGIFTLIINALMLLLTAELVPGFSINSFSSAFIGALVLSLISIILNKVIE
ncbi:MAG TPA: phage holin family protein [Desulfitobacteriaceae bacterium]|nr:phage holin family protein [Desulfitobacteriaceae bacterium]